MRRDARAVWPLPAGAKSRPSRGIVFAGRSQQLPKADHLVSMLTVRSVPDHDEELTAAARIRRTAMALFGEKGFAATTVRAIAAAAGVSTALVFHHFGSKRGLAQAIDDWLFDLSADQKRDFIVKGIFAIEPAHPDDEAIIAYLARVISDGGEAAEVLFARLVTGTVDILDAGIAAGTVKPSPDPTARAGVLVAQALGTLLLSDALSRHLGGESITKSPAYERFAAASLQIYTEGVFTGALPSQRTT